MKKVISYIVYIIVAILLIFITILLLLVLVCVFILRIAVEPVLDIVHNYSSSPKWFDWLNMNIQNLIQKING